MRHLIITIFLSTIFISAFSQDNLMLKYANTITSDEIKAHIGYLASDELEGRDTGAKGQKLAAKYIYKEFKEMGASMPTVNGASNYFQAFNLEKSSYSNINISAGKNELNLNDDFYVFGQIPEGEIKKTVVFAGYGYETDDYSDYKKINPKGKYTLILDTEPKDIDGNSLVSKNELTSTYAGFFQKMRAARQQEAAGIIFVFEDEENYKKTIKAYGGMLNSGSLTFAGEAMQTSFFPTIITNMDGACKILNVKKHKINKLLNKVPIKGKSPAGHFSKKIKINSTKKKETISTENVVAIIEGSDLKDEYIIFVAHYDHVGQSDKGIYNGADDNASGTCSLIEIAEAYAEAKKDGHGPRRSLIFATVTGEEKGLLGSEFYYKNPLVPLSQTKICINIDMIGRTDPKHKDKPNYLSGHTFLSSELFELSKEMTEKHLPEFSFEMNLSTQKISGGSDHYHFANGGIPSLSYFQGIHEDYHKPTDTADKIEYEKVVKIQKMIFALSWELANSDTIPSK